MNHWIRAVLALAIPTALVPSCGASGGRVGDPCTPDDEYYESFAGFDLQEEVAIRQEWDCGTRLCIVDRFQGRTTCPLGQREPRPCSGIGDTSCGETGAVCQQAGEHVPSCDGAAGCAGELTCNTHTWQCECASDSACPDGYACDQASRLCRRFVCHVPGSCQRAGDTDEGNAGKACCVPGTDRPIGTSVCAQCGDVPPEEAVYCSCRCDGPNPCACPDEFECRTMRYVPANGPTPKYCFRKRADPMCESVHGAEGPSCN